MFIQHSPATHHVQSVTVREEEGNGLKVECLFAQGSPESTTCTVVVEGEEGGWNETFRGSFLFPHLPTGIYNITVYDGATIENQEPAVVIVIEIDGEPTTSSTSPDSTSDTGIKCELIVNTSNTLLIDLLQQVIQTRQFTAVGARRTASVETL